MRDTSINTPTLNNSNTFDLNNPTALDDIIKWIAYLGEHYSKQLNITTEVFNHKKATN
jgi:hypothetical protein